MPDGYNGDGALAFVDGVENPVVATARTPQAIKWLIKRLSETVWILGYRSGDMREERGRNRYGKAIHGTTGGRGECDCIAH